MKDNKKLRIYLGDLVHNFLGGGSYMFPLNIGFLASYAKKIFGDEIDIELYKYPGELIERLKSDPPHVLGLSNYTWSANLNNEISGLAKSVDATTMVVWGGPNINQTNDGYVEFFRENPMVDFYAINEGEPGFANLLKQFIESEADIKRSKQDPVDGCVFFDREPICGKRLDRIEDIDIIPSPYLTGTLDKFFDYDLIPIIETNRGCPFTCTFCAQGLVSQHKVKMYDIGRVLEELDYIADHVKKTNLLCFADANFGIAGRDIKIAERIRFLQQTKGYPRRCTINWVKTRKSIEIAEIMGEATYLVSSLQSLDPVALKNVKRSNVDSKYFREIVDHVNDAGGVSGTEIILALPGETKESHLNSLRTLFSWNVSYIICYNCLLIDGSELTLPEERKRFALTTKFRLIDSAFGQYNGILSFESEEGIRSTSTMSEEEILFFRPVHWLIQFSWNYRCYFDLMKFVYSKGINPVDFIVALIENSHRAPQSVRSLFNDFRDEAKNEWFETPEDLRRHYSKPENFEFIREGGVGKMNGKYTWRVILECKKDFDSYIGSVASEMLPAWKSEIDDLVTFASHALLDFSSGIDFGATSEVEFVYDILAWRKNRYEGDLKKKKNKKLFYFPEEKEKALNVLLDQYRHQNMNVTMRKMTEHMRITDLYYDIKEV